MRLQGMNPTQFKVAVSDVQLGKQLGNTMSVNVLERLLVRLLPAAKLARRSEVKDRWASGAAVKMLARTRGSGFKAISKKARDADAKLKAKRARGSALAASPSKRQRRR